MQGIGLSGSCVRLVQGFHNTDLDLRLSLSNPKFRERMGQKSFRISAWSVSSGHPAHFELRLGRSGTLERSRRSLVSPLTVFDF